jgi:hypothetical protein
MTLALVAATLACSDDSSNSSVGASVSESESDDSGSENGDGDGESSSGDGDGDSGDGDGDTGDGDGDGDGDSGDGDGDGDGDSGDGDGDSGDGDGDSGDGDGDSGDGDGDGDSGDGDCDPTAFVGQALADDPWTEGSLCDEIWVCASANQAQMLMDLLDVVQCEPANGCPEQHCTLSYQTIATAQDVADACTALSVPGIDEVYCVVYGP